MWINRVKLPNLLVVSSTGKLSVLADASVVSSYICTAVCICLYTRYIFFGGSMYIRARLTAGYISMHICVTTAVCMYVYMYGHHIQQG